MSPRMAILLFTKSSIVACAIVKSSNQNHVEYLTGFELEKEYPRVFIEDQVLKSRMGAKLVCQRSMK
jgi:hypothetical protein